MKPLANRLFVLQDPEREYVGGVIVPASKGIVKSQAQLGRFGTVTAVGPDVDRDQIKPGDRVCYGEFEYPKTPNGEFVLSEMDICGVLDE